MRSTRLFGSLRASKVKDLPTGLVEPPSASPDYFALDLVLQDKSKASKLIHVLMLDTECPDYQRLVIHQEFNKQLKPSANKLRCLLALQEMNKAPSKTDRIARARKIVANFVQCGSMFHVTDMPRELTSALLDNPVDANTNYGYFKNLGDFCVQVLLENQVFMNQVHSLLKEGNE